MQIGPTAAVPPTAGGWSVSPARKPSAAEQAFLDYAKKSPAEKMRESILGSLGLTEEKLKAMSAKERAAVEEKIREIMKAKIEQSTEKKTGQMIDVKA
jgi:hypothetical protein